MGWKQDGIIFESDVVGVEFLVREDEGDIEITWEDEELVLSRREAERLCFALGALLADPVTTPRR